MRSECLMSLIPAEGYLYPRYEQTALCDSGRKGLVLRRSPCCVPHTQRGTLRPDASVWTQVFQRVISFGCVAPDGFRVPVGASCSSLQHFRVALRRVHTRMRSVPSGPVSAAVMSSASLSASGSVLQQRQRVHSQGGRPPTPTNRTPDATKEQQPDLLDAHTVVCPKSACLLSDN